MHRDFEIEATRYRGSLIKQIPKCCITNMQELFLSAFVSQGKIPSLTFAMDWIVFLVFLEDGKLPLASVQSDFGSLVMIGQNRKQR